MVTGYLVEVPLLSRQLLFVLLLQDLEVKIQKSLDFRSVFCLQGIYVGKKLVEGLQKPLVKLRPV